MSDFLEKIDTIRQRMNVSYEEAQKALDLAGGDVVQALILLEKKSQKTHGWTERVQVQGNELVAKIKDLIREGNVRKVVVKQEDKTVFELPLTFGAIGALLAPQIAAIGAVAALVTRCTIEIERIKPEGGAGEPGPKCQ
jgi:hypothetical protein